MSEKNGTLKLIAKLKEYMPPDTEAMHAIRKEFIKKVFAGYIKQIPVKSNIKFDADEKEDAAYGSSGQDNIGEDHFNINTISERRALKELVLNNIDLMDTTLVFRLYYQLAHELKDKL